MSGLQGGIFKFIRLFFTLVSNPRSFKIFTIDLLSILKPVTLSNKDIWNWIELFLWVLRNGHKHINRQDSYQHTSPETLFSFLLEYGDYIMIREAFIYVDKPYQYISYEILQEIFEPDSYDILKFLTNCSKIRKVVE